jgi:hypothetical protein
MNSGPVQGLPQATPSATGTKPVVENDSFTSSKALETALKTTPDTRAEAMERGRALLSDSNYPSADTVKKLSEFLASRLQSAQD